MKIAALVTVAALACGTAFAQSSSSTTSGDTSATHSKSSAMANDSQPKGEGIVDKTKRAFHRLGEKLKAGSSKSADTTDKTAQQNPETTSTRAMGASGADKTSSSRQSRMDEAYSNSKKSSSTEKADK